MFGLGTQGGLDQQIRADRIVLDGCERILLHQRHMLECSGVIDDVRLVAMEDFCQQVGVRHAAQDGGFLNPALMQNVINLIEAAL